MSVAKNACQQLVEGYAGLAKEGDLVIPPSFRLLASHGKAFKSAAIQPMNQGALGMCYQNAYQRMNAKRWYAEGYAMKPGLIPLAHAWLVTGEGEAADPTWGKDKGCEYFGVQFDPHFVYEIADKTGHYGIFEGLYLLKMSSDACYEYLVSGVAK